ncbi:MAG: DUF3368 domain-containing protein [Armatimonadetes bacterium]|nr:DUF3368 domain-containing protein [Armatimonadota bacterium]MDW8029968.1 DUF3368 domain-containing protein [Armatimonadota bacterium]
MRVVSNTSPIMNLALIGRLDLLQALYTQLFIPEAVGKELECLAQHHNELKGIVGLDWIKQMSVQNRVLVKSLQSILDEGEAEAIALAAELGADLLLIDERHGRKVCQRLGIKVIGLVGVLIEAKRRGILHEVKPYLDALVGQAGFWLSQPVYIRAMKEVGEA